MPTNTNETALEQTIEAALTGTTRERLAKAHTPTAPGQPAVAELDPGYNHQGFRSRPAGSFDAAFALDQELFWEFLQATQPGELKKLQRSADWKLRILTRYDRMVKKHGILRLLRRGLKVEDARLTLFYQLPPENGSQTVRARFESNVFSVTRQVRYHVQNPREEIDMVVFLNGIPLATLELKNHWTGQNARHHGVKQYRNDRDPRQPLLQFGRCLVHFAVDTEEVWMTTKLTGKTTFFLPFNKGTEAHGAGNPVNPRGHKTAYLWQDLFTRHALAGVIQHFARLDGKATDPLAKRTLFFPRYHQWDVVRRIVDHATDHGAGQTYLVQHSAGSGKSNSITWAAYQLIEVYRPGQTDPLFDSVIVVTDRRLLDKQLRDNITDFNQSKSIIAAARKSTDLRAAMESGKRIIITTIQKFPFIVDEIADLAHKRFAVIIDEAHSSQSGTAAAKMNEALGAGAGASVDGEEQSEDGQDLVLKAMASRKMATNASYLAFTATPKNATLERFGQRRTDGTFAPFHLYSMKQAIEEGFILDVLANYTTYRSYYELEKSIADNPAFDTVKAQKRLKAFVEADPRTIATKAEIMLDHFLTKVVGTKLLRGKAKGMVITQNIETAVRYYQALNRLLDDRGKPFKILVAFSGKKTVDGIEHTEATLNNLTETKEAFDTDEYRLLVVANKYLTGFDQPKLTAMYVDKRLQGVLAVQALSRLNRANPKLGKKTADLFVLDFFNDVQDIQAAFEPFYTATSLSQATDVGVLHDLMDLLGDVGVYDWPQVERFTQDYFAGVEGEQLSALLDPCVKRYDQELELEDTVKITFKVQAKQFVKLYGQVASIIDFSVREWEELYWFLKFLIPKLRVADPDTGAVDGLMDTVDLSTYGLERTRANHSIGLDDAASELDPANASPRTGAGAGGEEEELDLIIRSFNERFFQGWEATPEEQRIKFVSLAQSLRNHPDYEAKVKDNQDEMNAELAFKKILGDVMNKQRRQEMELYKLWAKDDAFRSAFVDSMRRMVG